MALLNLAKRHRQLSAGFEETWQDFPIPAGSVCLLQHLEHASGRRRYCSLGFCACLWAQASNKWQGKKGHCQQL